MGKDDYGPIAQYNSLTDPYLQGFFSKNIIRNHLRQTGLISRKGDIIPEEVWRKRIATKEKMHQASRLVASKIVQQAIELKNLEQAELRRKLDEVAKKELGQSAQTRELPLLWPSNRGYSEERLRTRSRSRSPKMYETTFIEDSQSFDNDRHRQYRRTGQKLGSKRLSSKKRLTKLNRGYALLPKPEPTPVMVTMYYYGKSINIPFDTQVFEYRDEISIYQQHCGGENLLVYSGLHQAGDKFEFRSKRHKEYPFSLTIYINSTYDCRISTCCEYKHQLNVKIGGKGGRFAITNVTGSEPCIKCLLEKSEKEAKRRKEKELRQKEEETRVDDIEVIPDQPVNSRKNSDQEPKEIEVKHEEDKNESYDDEWHKGDDNEEEEEDKEEESSADSVKSESKKSIRSIVEQEIDKIKIPVKHEEDEITDVSSTESKESLPESKRKSSVLSTESAKQKPNRYSSNDVIDIIEKGTMSRASKKSTADNTSEDESKLDSVREKAKTPSKKSSKASSRAGSAKSKISSNSDSLSDDQNDSDTEKLLNRIKSGRTNQSKAMSPTKSKTPSQKNSRNTSPARSVAKSPSLKSPKESKPTTPVEQSDNESQKGSRVGSPARSITKSPSLKSPSGSRASSPNKSAYKQTSPVEDKTSRKSSARSQKSIDDEQQRAKKSPSPKAKSIVQKENLFSSSDEEDSSDLTEDTKKGETDLLKTRLSETPVNETNNLVDDTNSRHSPTKNSNTSPDLVKSPSGSRQNLEQNDQRPDSSASKKSDGKGDSPKKLSRSGSLASKNASRPPSTDEKNEDQDLDRPDSSASKKSDDKGGSPKKLSRSGSLASKNASRPPSTDEKNEDQDLERPDSSASKKSDGKGGSPKKLSRSGSPASKKSSRPSSKNSLSAERPLVPQVNIIPSSDVEKNSDGSFNDETKWYKDNDVQH